MKIRYKQYSKRTEEAYTHWIKRYIFFHGKRLREYYRQAGFTACVAEFPRHPCAVSKYDIRTVQELLGYADVSTTMIYTYVLNKGGRGVVSPLDHL